MTHAEILAMQPGPELDNALATALGGRCSKGGLWNGDRFMGYVVNLVQWEDDGEIENLPPLSTTWEGMRLVVEAMAARGWTLHLTARADWNTAAFRHPSLPDWAHWVEDNEIAPHAVAIAALLALEGK